MVGLIIQTKLFAKFIYVNKFLKTIKIIKLCMIVIMNHTVKI